METPKKDVQRTMSSDDVRAGVTGHHVRYVLAAGLVGVTAAFITIGIYFNYDMVSAYVAESLARDPIVVLRETAPYIIVFLSGALAVLVLFSVWNLILGPSEDASQRVMRLRVISQFVIICSIAAMLFFLTP